MSDMTTEYRSAYSPIQSMGEVKTYFVGVRGLSISTLTGLLADRRGPHCIYYDGNEMWITIVDDDEIIQIGVPNECIEGDRQPFYLNDAKQGHCPSFADVVFRVAVNYGGKSEVYLMNIPAVSAEASLKGLGFSNLPTCAEQADLISPTIDVNQLCHTWAISCDLGKKVTRKVMSFKTKTKPLHACISARASNIGVEYFDWDSGEIVEEFKVLSTRYGGKYIGRSESWKRVTGTLAFSLIKENDKTNVMHFINHDDCKIVEFYFPRARVPIALTKKEGDRVVEDVNILGTQSNDDIFLCGVGIVKDSGVVIRSFKRRPFQKGYPLMRVPPKTTFDENYSPFAQPQTSWTLIGERLGDEEMTPKELETVKKWWAGYLQHLIRKGEVPSEDEVECARKLGVYTGN